MIIIIAKRAYEAGERVELGDMKELFPFCFDKYEGIVSSNYSIH
jgi:hypothetical protein